MGAVSAKRAPVFDSRALLAECGRRCHQNGAQYGCISMKQVHGSILYTVTTSKFFPHLPFGGQRARSRRPHTQCFVFRALPTPGGGKRTRGAPRGSGTPRG